MISPLKEYESLKWRFKNPPKYHRLLTHTLMLGRIGLHPRCEIVLNLRRERREAENHIMGTEFVMQRVL